LGLIVSITGYGLEGLTLTLETLEDSFSFFGATTSSFLATLTYFSIFTSGT
jgi:hypothetical protein